MKAIKIILITLLCIFSFVIISVIIGLNQLAKKETIVKLIHDQTQAQATLEEVSVKWFPLSLSLKGLSLNPKDSNLKLVNPKQPAISLAELNLYVDLKAGVQKKIKVSKIELKKAVINAAILANGELDILQWLAPQEKITQVSGEYSNTNSKNIIQAGVGNDESADSTFILNDFSLEQTTLNLKLVKENALVNVKNLSISTKDFKYPLAKQLLTNSIDIKLAAEIAYEQIISSKKKTGSAKANVLLNGTTTMSYLIDKGEFFPNIITTKLRVDEQSKITVSESLLSEINQVIGLASKFIKSLPSVSSTFNIAENVVLAVEYNAPKEIVNLLQPIKLTSQDWGLSLGKPGAINLAKKTQHIGMSLIADQALSQKASQEINQGSLASLGLDKLLFTDNQLTLKGQLKGSFENPKISVDESLKPKNLLKETIKSEIGNQLKGILGF